MTSALSPLAGRPRSRRDAGTLAPGVAPWKRGALILSALILLFTLAGCGGSASTLLPHLRGPRTAGGKLLIDEAQGRFAGLRLGMSIAAARRLLPARNYWKGGSGNGRLAYCSSIRNGTCSGDVELDVVTACAVTAKVRTSCPYTGAMGPVTEIDLFANGGQANQFVNPETWQAVSSRGIHLGSEITRVKRAYTVTARARDVDCAVAGAGGPTLTAVVGNNTIVFTELNGVVYGITLFMQKQPDACSQ